VLHARLNIETRERLIVTITEYPAIDLTMCGCVVPRTSGTVWRLLGLSDQPKTGGLVPAGGM